MMYYLFLNDMVNSSNVVKKQNFITAFIRIYGENALLSSNVNVPAGTGCRTVTVTVTV